MNRFKFLSAFVAVALFAGVASACPPIAVRASGVHVSNNYQVDVVADAALLGVPVTYQTYAVPTVSAVSVLAVDACAVNVQAVAHHPARVRVFGGRRASRVRVNVDSCH